MGEPEPVTTTATVTILPDPVTPPVESRPTAVFLQLLKQRCLEYRQFPGHPRVCVGAHLVNSQSVRMTDLWISSPSPATGYPYWTMFMTDGVDGTEWARSATKETIEEAWEECFRKFQELHCCQQCQKVCSSEKQLAKTEHLLKCMSCLLQDEVYREREKNPDECCSICMHHLYRAPAVITSCRHRFHDRCLGPALPRCPLCRVPIVSVDKVRHCPRRTHRATTSDVLLSGRSLMDADEEEEEEDDDDDDEDMEGN